MPFTVALTFKESERTAHAQKRRHELSTGTAPTLLLDLATSTIADRQRTARDRDQRAAARRTRVRRGRRA